MSRFLTTKRIILALVLLFAACGLYGYLVADRLKREGVEARAVVTRVYSREETRTRGTARRPRYEKVTVHYLDYRLTVDGRDYEDRIRRYDNLMTARLAASERDFYRAQGTFTGRLVEFAKRNEVHVHLVAHPRKTDRERPLDADDVGGSGEVTNARITHSRSSVSLGLRQRKPVLRRCSGS